MKCESERCELESIGHFSGVNSGAGGPGPGVLGVEHLTEMKRCEV